jgi:hypothetical protein
MRSSPPDGGRDTSSHLRLEIISTTVRPFSRTDPMPRWPANPTLVGRAGKGHPTDTTGKRPTVRIGLAARPSGFPKGVFAPEYGLSRRAMLRGAMLRGTMLRDDAVVAPVPARRPEGGFSLSNLYGTSVKWGRNNWAGKKDAGDSLWRFFFNAFPQRSIPKAAEPGHPESRSGGGCHPSACPDRSAHVVRRGLRL